MWKSFVAGCVALTAFSAGGCQSWQPGMYPLQNMSRVSPPATGTYQLPNGYYNNSTSSLNNGTQAMTASTAANQPAPVNGALPTTRLASQPNASNGVVPAQFTSPSTGPVAGGFPSQPNLSQPNLSQSNMSQPNMSNAAVTTAQFTGGNAGNSPNSANAYQAGNFETRDFQGSSSGTIADVPSVTTDPELQWRP